MNSKEYYDDPYCYILRKRYFIFCNDDIRIKLNDFCQRNDINLLDLFKYDPNFGRKFNQNGKPVGKQLLIERCIKIIMNIAKHLGGFEYHEKGFDCHYILWISIAGQDMYIIYDDYHNKSKKNTTNNIDDPQYIIRDIETDGY